MIVGLNEGDRARENCDVEPKQESTKGSDQADQKYIRALSHAFPESFPANVKVNYNRLNGESDFNDGFSYGRIFLIYDTLKISSLVIPMIECTRSYKHSMKTINVFSTRFSVHSIVCQ
jgi:hypothetical protein